ncbi:MAG: outer membrane beta-barrel protein, partial [Candidatus Sulfotelmatobacter sp.]
LVMITILLLGRGIAQSAPSGQTAATPDSAAQQPAAQQPAAQQPAAQQPAAQQPASDQEPAEEESSSSRRKAKPRDYKNWSYNVGLGANVDSGTTKTYVRGGGGVASAGVARNANKYFGLRGDFFFADLPLRDSSLLLAQAGSASSYFFALTVGPVINIPVTKLWGGYLLFGPGYYHRMGNLNTVTAVPGSTCNGFYEWWGACSSVSIPLSGSFVHSSQNQFGYNVGAGITRKMPSGVEVYAEFRLTHGSANGTTIDVRPITIGVRW